MDFALYSSKYDDGPVESGLSSGEVRQALLDRIKGTVRVLRSHEAADVAFRCFGHVVGFSDDEFLATPETAEARIEDKLYALADEALSGTVWQFAHEVIYVEGAA